eukprot:TRINITY_DN4809_c0_g1_i1.p1 TRINITY_DN4809_c0_g1~~TRINITY_DN4809_c0_g1_i1.p1  ORF type:complete len:1617 (+),score=495.79 TRINITY_DN4809_c0_g1_i1:75-4925(+)
MSIKQAVQSINESLSSNIPELVLLLIAMQEQGKPPTPALLSAVEGVAKSAEVLANIANSLATEQYGDYADIKKEITDASTHVMDCANVLKQTTRKFDTGALKQAYGDVMDSARVIAGECINLLSIVYGASFKKCLIDNEKFLVEAESITPSLAQSDPQTFADKTSELATKAAEMAAGLKILADDEEAPLRKQQILAASVKLEKGSDELIEKCNAYLQDPSNAGKLSDFHKALQAMKAEVHEVSKPVAESHREVQEQTNVAKATQTAATKATQHVQHATEVEEPGNLALYASDPIPQSGVFEDIPAELDRQRRQLEALTAAVKSGDAKLAVAIVRNLTEKYKPLLLSMVNSTHTCKDAARRHQLEQMAKQMSGLFPSMVSTVKDAFQDMQNEEKRKKQELAAAELQNLLADLNDCFRRVEQQDQEELLLQHETAQPSARWGDIAKKPPKQVSAAKFVKALESIVAASRAKDWQALKAALDQFKKEKDELMREARAAGIDEASLRLLDECLQRLEEACNKYAAAPSEVTLREVTDVAEAITKAGLGVAQRATHAVAGASAGEETVRTAQVCRSACDELRDALQARDASAAKDTAVKVKRDLNAFLDAAVASAKQLKDGAAVERCRDKTQELERRLPLLMSQVEAMQQAKTPEELENTALKALNLLENVDQGVAAIVRLSKAVPQELAFKAQNTAANLQTAALLNSKPLVLKQSQTLARTTAALAEDLLQQAQNTSNPQAAAALKKSVAQLEEALPKLLKSAEQVIREGSNISPASRLVLEKATAEYISAVAAGEAAMNSAERGSSAPYASALGPITAEAAEERMSVLADELRSRVQSALGDPQAAQQLQTDLPRMLSELDSLISQLHVPAEEEAFMACDSMMEACTELKEAAALQDGQKVASAAEAVADIKPAFVAQVQRMVAAQPPSRKPECSRLLESITSALDLANELAQSVSASPNDQAKTAELMQQVDAAMGSLQVLANEAVPPAAEKLVSAIATARAALTEVASLANDKTVDVAKAERALVALQKSLEDVHAAAGSIVQTLASPAKRQEAAKCLTELDAAAFSIADAVATLRKSPQEGAALTSTMAKQAASAGRALEALGVALSAQEVALVDKELGALHRIDDAVSAHDAQSAVAAAKELVQTQRAVVDACRARVDPNSETGKRALEAASQLEALLPGHVTLMKAAITNPSPQAAEEVRQSAARFRAPLAEVREALNPTLTGPMMKQVNAARRNALALADAAKQSNESEIQEALHNLRHVANELKSMSQTGPGMGNVFELVQHFDGLLQKAEQLTSKPLSVKDAATMKQLSAVAQTMQQPLDRIELELGAPSVSRAASVQARARKLVRAAKRRGASAAADLARLLAATRLLSDALAGVARLSRGDALSAAREAEAAGGKSALNERAKAALELDELLCHMEAEFSTTEPAIKPSRGLDDLLAAIAPSKATAGAGAATAPKTLDSAIVVVAHEMKQLSAQKHAAMPALATSKLNPNNAIDQLQLMAEAARTGNRQQLLLSGRAIAACMNTLAAELALKASQCRNALYQDQMVRASTAIRNFAVQLKILSTVKAASVGSSEDTDDQITSVLRSLQAAMTNGLQAIETAVKVNLIHL